MKTPRLTVLIPAILLLALPALQAQSLTVEGDLNVEGDATIGDVTNRGSLLIYGPTGASAANAVTIQSDGGFVMEGTYGMGDMPSVTAGKAAFMWFPGKSALVVGRNNPGHTSDLYVAEDSIAIGRDTSASGANAIAIGSYSETTEYYSLTVGVDVVNYGEFSVAIGSGSEVWVDNTILMGKDVFNFGEGSLIVGLNVINYGVDVSALGNMMYVESDTSALVGHDLTTSGDSSVLVGSKIEVFSDFGGAFGTGLFNNSYGATYIGRYNHLDYINATPGVWVASDPLFVVSNGKSNAERSDSLVINKNGETLIKGYGANSGEIILKPQDGASYIEIDGMRVVTEGSGQGEGYLTESESDAKYVSAAATELGLANGTSTHADTLVVGTGNVSTSVGQLVVGRYSDANDATAFAVGTGADAANRQNAFSVETTGDAYVGRDLHVARNASIEQNVSVQGDLLVNPSGGLSMGAFVNGTTPLQSSFDPDTLSYLSTIGSEIPEAQQVKVNNLVKYLKQNSLWGEACVLLFLEGDGTSTNPLGGWTSNSASLFGSPAWLSGGGLEFDGVNDYAELDLTGFQGLSNLTNFVRMRPTSVSTANSCYLRVFTFGDNIANQYLTAGLSPSTVANEVWSMSFAPGPKVLGATASDYSWAADEDFVQVLNLSSNGTSLWKGVTPISLSITSGASVSTDLTPSALGFTANDKVYLGAAYSSGVLPGKMDGEVVMWMMVKSEVTTEQREWVTAWMEAW